MVMDGCQVVEQGTHTELIDVPESRYKRLTDVVTTTTTHNNTESVPRSSTRGRLSALSTGPTTAGFSAARLLRVTSTETKQEGSVTLSTVDCYLRSVGSWPFIILLYFPSWLYNFWAEVVPDIYVSMCVSDGRDVLGTIEFTVSLMLELSVLLTMNVLNISVMFIVASPW